MSNEWIDVSDVTPRIAYTATASQTAFTVPFVFFEDEDLHVYQNAVQLTLNTDYTVTGAEESTGGSITLTTGATVGDEILITRRVPIEQTTHIPPSGPLDVPAINVQISKLIAIDQQNADDIERSFHFPDSDSTASAELADATTRANKLIGFDADGAVIYPLGPTYVDSTFTAVATVDSRATAMVTTFEVSVNVVITGGYATPGDGGGAMYSRVVSQPSHVFKFQSADGAWWEIIYSNGLNLRSGGAGLGNSTVDDTAMDSALTLGSGSGATKSGISIRLPAGTYTFTTGKLIDRSYSSIVGDGVGQTTVRFNPTANATLFTIYNSASVGPTENGIRYVTIKGMTIRSTDTTHTKTAINIKNADVTYLKDLFIDDWDTTAGRSSVGIYYQGRDFCRCENVDVFANNPLLFSQNPDRATYSAKIDSDFWHAIDCQFSVDPISPTVLNSCIQISAGCNISRMRWTNVWVGGGGHGFYWYEDGTHDQASTDIIFDGFYDEQKQNASYSTIFIDYTLADSTLRDVSFRNILCASEGAGLTIYGGASVFIENVDVDGLTYSGSSHVFHVDAGIRDFRWKNLNLPVSSSTASLSTQVLRNGEYWRSGSVLPSQGSLALVSRDLVSWHGDASGDGYRVGTIRKVVRLTNGAGYTLTAFSDFDVKWARVTVVGGITEGGTALFTEGVALAALSGTSNFAVTNTGSKLCVVRSSDTNVQVVNNLGSTTSVMILTEFAAVPNP